MGAGKPRDSSLVPTALGSKRRMRRAATSYLAKHPAPHVLSDLAQHQCITATELQPWTFQTGQKERTLRVTDRRTVNSFEGIHDACMAGAGIALLSSWYTAEYLQSGSLVAIALEDAQPKELAVWAVCPTWRQVLPKVRVFVEAMRESGGKVYTTRK